MRNTFIIFSILGVINSLFLTGLIILTPFENKRAKNYLIILISLLTIRIGKSVFILLTKLPLEIIGFGLFAFFCIGPTIYLYVNSYKTDNKYNNPYFPFLHFIIPAVYFIFIFKELYYRQPDLWRITYWFLLAYYLLYWIKAFIIYRSLFKENSLNLSLDKIIMKCILSGAIIIWVAYFLNSVLRKGFPYIIGPMMYSIILYLSIILIYRIFISSRRKTDSVKYLDQNLSKEEINKYLELLCNKVNEKKLFLNPDITLSSLSDELNIRPQILSRIINETYNKNFNEFINHHRIKYSCELLDSNEYKNQKIAAIAFNSGFNSLSVFNTTFKKYTGLTPSEFRKKL